MEPVWSGTDEKVINEAIGIRYQAYQNYEACTTAFLYDFHAFFMTRALEWAHRLSENRI